MWIKFFLATLMGYCIAIKEEHNLFPFYAISLKRHRNRQFKTSIFMDFRFQEPETDSGRGADSWSISSLCVCGFFFLQLQMKVDLNVHQSVLICAQSLQQKKKNRMEQSKLWRWRQAFCTLRANIWISQITFPKVFLTCRTVFTRSHFNESFTTRIIQS